MVDRIKLVQNDTGPQIRVVLSDQVTGNPIDLTGATVTLNFREVEGTTALFSRPAFINPEYAPSGIAYIEWEPGDLNVPAGDYEGEIEVVNATGARETIYEKLRFRVREEIA